MFFWMFFLHCFEAVRRAQTTLCLPGEGGQEVAPPPHPLGTPGCQVGMGGSRASPCPLPAGPSPVTEPG